MRQEVGAGGDLGPDAKLDAFSGTALHLGEAEGVADLQLLLVRAQTYQASPHILAHSTWTWLAEGCYQAHMREVRAEFFSTHHHAAHIAYNTAQDRSLMLLNHANG